MLKLSKTCLLVTCALLGMGVSTAGHASPPITHYNPIPTSVTEVRPYVGLSWALGEGYAPSVVTGVATAVVHTEGETQGADVSAMFGFADGFSFKKVQADYLYGNDQVQGEAGGGYSFAKGTFLANAGVNADYFNLSLDNYFDQTFVPQITIRSLGTFRKPEGKTVPVPPII